jgi:hypothetical protein
VQGNPQTDATISRSSCVAPVHLEATASFFASIQANKNPIQASHESRCRKSCRSYAAALWLVVPFQVGLL